MPERSEQSAVPPPDSIETIDEIRTPAEALRILRSLRDQWRDMPDVRMTREEQMANPHDPRSHNKRRATWFTEVFMSIEVVAPFLDEPVRQALVDEVAALHDTAIEHRIKLHTLNDDDVQRGNKLLERAIVELERRQGTP